MILSLIFKKFSTRKCGYLVKPCVFCLLAMVANFLFFGCGHSTINKRVDPDVLKEASLAGQITIYDAENESVISMDQLDVAKEELTHIRRQIEQAQHLREKAEKRKNNQGVKMVEAWEEYLEMMEDWAEDNVKLQEFRLVVTEALIEFAKAQVVQREDLVGDKDFKLEEFKQQYEALNKELDNLKNKTADKRKEARKLEEKWWKMRDKYIANSGDYDTGLWTE